MIELLNYAFMQKALIAAILVGIATGLLGPYLVLRRLSLVGEGLAHLAFGGIALGFLIGIYPYGIALFVAIVGSLLIRYLIKRKVYGEAAIALILAFGVGLGVTILGATNGFGVDLFSFLIGSILTLQWSDILILTILATVVVIFFALFRKELFMLSFQQDLAQVYGKRSEIADTGFVVIVAAVTIMSIQAVGILLVSSLLVIPALIALKISHSFKQTVLLSILIAVGINIVGIFGSFYYDVPTSGFIVLSLLACYGIATIFARE
ncbi:MAG: metal ABC transporter permease [Candidatus Woesearchaeota archaeon]